MNIPQTLLLILGTIILYEIIRGRIKTIILKRQNRSVKKYIDLYNIKLDKYKFMNRIIIKQEILNNREINRAIIAHAEETGRTIAEIKNEVEDYIDEIIPSFNLLSYFKVGYWISNLILNFIYEVVIDRENAEKLKKIREDNVVVFLMNHRSNIDYIIVAYMLARNISLSYAVGEWARVWPLEYIFKSFGAYFIRRKFRKPIYHLVLEKYVQLISLQGVTQGIFLEGGLSRDGKLGEAKLGIFDYIIKILQDPTFKKDIIFVPVGINYDRVLEDRILIREWKENRKRTGFRENIRSLARIAVMIPYLFISNLARVMLRRLKHHGYASVSFGNPVSARKFVSSQGKEFLSWKRERRLPVLAKFAASIMKEISHIIPVTPVTVTSKAILSLGGKKVGMNELLIEVNRLRIQYKIEKRRIVLGRDFEKNQKSHEKLRGERAHRRIELLNFEEDFLGADDALKTLNLGLAILKKRKIIRVTKASITIAKGARPFLEFYANSLEGSP